MLFARRIGSSDLNATGPRRTGLTASADPPVVQRTKCRVGIAHQQSPEGTNENSPAIYGGDRNGPNVGWALPTNKVPEGRLNQPRCENDAQGSTRQTSAASAVPTGLTLADGAGDSGDEQEFS